jgi:hypothetical protein
MLYDRRPVAAVASLRIPGKPTVESLLLPVRAENRSTWRQYPFSCSAFRWKKQRERVPAAVFR